jgi:hypothetical protein
VLLPLRSSTHPAGAKKDRDTALAAHPISFCEQQQRQMLINLYHNPRRAKQGKKSFTPEKEGASLHRLRGSSNFGGHLPVLHRVD